MNSQRRFRNLAGAMLLAWTALACGQAQPDPEPAENVAPDALVIESIELGLGFDEPVTIEGESEAGAATTTTVALATDEAAETYDAEVVATDASGNEARVRVEVHLGAATESL